MPNQEHWLAAGARVKDARTTLGWTVERLARESGVSISVLHQIERGDGEGRKQAIKRRVSVALGWSPESLEQLGRRGREPVPGQPRADPTSSAIAEQLTRLPTYQQRLIEEQLRYLVELNRRIEEAGSAR